MVELVVVGEAQLLVELKVVVVVVVVDVAGVDDIGLYSGLLNELAAASASQRFAASFWSSFQCCVLIVEAFASELTDHCIPQMIWQIYKEILLNVSPFVVVF